MQLPLAPEPNELISIGCISEDGKRFYAENSTTIFRPQIFSEFVVEIVVPLLEGGKYLIPYAEIARTLKEWLESFDGEVKMLSDSPFHDWVHVKHMFDTYGWPVNLAQKPVQLTFSSSIQNMRFQNAVESAFKTIQPQLRRHHALDDAIANRYGFLCATERGY